MNSTVAMMIRMTNEIQNEVDLTKNEAASIRDETERLREHHNK